MTPVRHERWRSARIVAELWTCGDDDCDCYEPRIERITPNLDAGYPWIRRELLWSGDYHSHPTPDERAKLRHQLEDAAARYKAEFVYRPVQSLTRSLLSAASLAREAIAAVDALQFHTDDKGVTSVATFDKWQTAIEALDRARQALASLP